jgi:hypothetical protein
MKQFAEVYRLFHGEAIADCGRPAAVSRVQSAAPEPALSLAGSGADVGSPRFGLPGSGAVAGDTARVNSSPVDAGVLFTQYSAAEMATAAKTSIDAIAT